ncbi:OmpA family protein [Sulfurovum sp. zt1-1]|uniref:OmpA family protein n=1 Tax=Sulfurovum zhangzhouensis TaxID=3019067 RepID=A0ABT7QWF9_9BACT|nr:OmpA family protein [Sulfurovum zhangzhouensis]MDM5271081.1 OmpA family protein [Sulfurovum zhangzhouensis]
MVKKICFSTVAALLMLSGCAQNTPDVGGNVSDANEIAPDTVSIDESNMVEDGSGVRYNSSSDGFVSVYFDFDGYNIAPSMENRVSHNAARAKSTGGSKVKLEGNCDEFGTDEYNYALGLKRARAVKEALADKGVDTSNVVMVSFGESSPACTDATDECYAQNRRVDLRLVK